MALSWGNGTFGIVGAGGSGGWQGRRRRRVSELMRGPELWCRSCPRRFEQEVLGAPVTGIPTAVPAVPTVPTVEAMQVPAAPVIRPIIATNTYQQVWLS